MNVWIISKLILLHLNFKQIKDVIKTEEKKQDKNNQVIQLRLVKVLVRIIHNANSFLLMYLFRNVNYIEVVRVMEIVKVAVTSTIHLVVKLKQNYKVLL